MRLQAPLLNRCAPECAARRVLYPRVWVGAVHLRDKPARHSQRALGPWWCLKKGVSFAQLMSLDEQGRCGWPHTSLLLVQYGTQDQQCCHFHLLATRQADRQHLAMQAACAAASLYTLTNVFLTWYRDARMCATLLGGAFMVVQLQGRPQVSCHLEMFCRLCVLWVVHPQQLVLAVFVTKSAVSQRHRLRFGHNDTGCDLVSEQGTVGKGHCCGEHISLLSNPAHSTAANHKRVSAPLVKAQARSATWGVTLLRHHSYGKPLARSAAALLVALPLPLPPPLPLTHPLPPRRPLPLFLRSASGGSSSSGPGFKWMQTQQCKGGAAAVGHPPVLLVHQGT
jgi:hypothetical protein